MITLPNLSFREGFANCKSWVRQETRAPPQFWKGDADPRFLKTLRVYLIANLLFEIGNFIFKELL